MTEIRGKPHTSPLDGTEAVPLSPDGYATTQEIADLAAGSAGSPVVRAFPFAFDTPDLLTGAALYTPTVGDVLLEAWVQIDTSWDGTNPYGDVGCFIGSNAGFFSGLTSLPLNMGANDGPAPGGNFLSGQQPSASQINMLLNVLAFAETQTGANPQRLAVRLTATDLANGSRLFPAVATTADPIKVCVSQDGMNTGDDPGSTQGSAVLYLVTATPA